MLTTPVVLSAGLAPAYLRYELSVFLLDEESNRAECRGCSDAYRVEADRTTVILIPQTLEQVKGVGPFGATWQATLAPRGTCKKFLVDSLRPR